MGLDSERSVMEIRKVVTKRRIVLLLLGILVLLILWVALTQPFIVHRLATRVFTGYEIYQLKYPNSYLVETETTATSKVSMATHYAYHTSDDIDTVQEYMEQQLPGFVHLQGPRVINEPTHRNTICADETAFRNVFQVLDKGNPCIEVSIYPSATSGTSIRISENWFSMGFPAWLRGL
jgi:hypothetical protein